MSDSTYWLLRSGNQFLLAEGGGAGNFFPRGSAQAFGDSTALLQVGEWLGLPCYACELDTAANLPGEWVPLRSLLSLVSAGEAALAVRASLLLDWQKNHHYCGNCAAPTVRNSGELSMVCSACGLVSYPRISPAVMVLILRGNELLLARGPRFRPGIYSALAGFVEAGETLEQCAVREVREEVGIEIRNLRYFGSQSWPFPDSLMVAFFADYASGEIRPEPGEIEDARWYSRDALPPLPEPFSLAWQMINAAGR